MKARKTRITILIVSILLILIIAIGILVYLYIKTDAFKSNETLFAKYFMQNTEVLEYIKEEDSLGIENILATNKYTSEITGEIQYTENKETSNENRNSKINDVAIKVDSQIDNTNNYKYRDVTIGIPEEELVKFSYIQESDVNVVKLAGLKQYISIKNTEEEVDGFSVQKIENVIDDIDLSAILNFTDDEKQTLANTYLGIIQANISNEKYYRQSNVQIQINEQSVKTNAYYIKLTLEEYNNLKIKILQQMENDDIILSRIDSAEDIIMEKYPNYKAEKSLRESFVENINEQIENIQNNNIGSQEVKITVYENNMNTVRTSIETQEKTYTLDFISTNFVELKSQNINSNDEEKALSIKKNIKDDEKNINIQYNEIQNNETIYNIELNSQQTLGNDINKTLTLKIANEKYESIFNIENNINIANQIETVNYEDEYINYDELDEEKQQILKEMLNQVINNQKETFNSVITKQDYIQMLQNLKIIKSDIQVNDEGGVTEIEKRRFNSQFEFYQSEDLTADEITQLIETSKNYFENMRIMLKDGTIEDLDLEKLSDDYNETREYKENISEMLIAIK